MSEPFFGQIIMFAGNFAPRNWAFCHGQLIPIQQNQSLFSILGTTYGGDGRTTFALPDLRGRVPVGEGTGPRLSQRHLGERFGEETVTLNSNQIPSHTHTFSLEASTDDGNTDEPGGAYPAKAAGGETVYSDNIDNATALGNSGIGNTGGGQSHDNMQPSLGINYIICIEGLYPSRN